MSQTNRFLFSTAFWCFYH